MPIQSQLERPRALRDRRRRELRDARPGKAEHDSIRCRDCGRTYPALDGPALLYSLKASCPSCGGSFEMAP